MAALPPPNLTEEEKVKIRHHTGYLNVQEAYTFVLGVPAGIETQFIVEGAMNRLNPFAVGMLREIIARCDALEEQLMCDADLYATTQLGNLAVNSTGKDNEQNLLLRNYAYQVASMCNLLGIERNPFDKRLNTLLGKVGNGGPNVRVVG